MKALKRDQHCDGSSTAIFHDFSWDFNFPDGRHERGTAESLEAAQEAADAVHTRFIVGCWNRGEPVKYGRFLCPLR